MLIMSLVMFAAGTICQLYSMFSPEEPYIQQLSFMFVAMPSVLAIIYHYYHDSHHIQASTSTIPESCAVPTEERNTSTTTQARKRALFQPNDQDVVVDTSHRRSASGCYDALAGYDNDFTDNAILD